MNTSAEEREASNETIFKGYCIDLLDRLKTELGFKYEFIQLAESYGAKIDGKWTGIMGELLSGVSVLLGSFAITSRVASFFFPQDML